MIHARYIIILTVLCPFLVIGEVKWYKFGVTEGKKQTITIGAVSIAVATRAAKGEWFPEDNLILTVRGKGLAKGELDFCSSYGGGAIAIEGDILLLKYGVGRGTAGGRVEHVKALSLSHSFEDSPNELFDMQISYWVASHDPKVATPDCVEYQITIEEDRDFSTFRFRTRDAGRGFPTEKIVKLKK